MSRGALQRLLPAGAGLLLVFAGGRQFPAAGAEAEPDPFGSARPFAIALTISEDGVRSLRQQSRVWVRASWNDGRQELTNVAVRLKGRIGSFRPIDDRPSLTIDFEHDAPGRRWHGLSRIHLNNSVEDPGCQHERLGGDLFRAAGVPAPRTAYGMVALNQRRLGLYVVKEGFTAEFLARHFPGIIGNLYEPEPGPGCDVDGPMKLNFGPGSTDRADLRRLADAAAEPDPARRWHRLGPLLNLDRFVTFLAMESLVGHRDGYGQARNNYRLYHDPGTGRFEFLPSGLDRLFARPDARLTPRFSGIVAQAVLATDEGQAAYAARLGTLFTNLFQNAAWVHSIQGTAAALGRTLLPSEARVLEQAGAELADRVQRRIAFIGEQLAQPDPAHALLGFTNGVAALIRWRPVDSPDHGRLEQQLEAGRPRLRIIAGPRTAASWRTRPRLGPGRYAFEARVRTDGLAPLPFGNQQGATVTVDGVSPSATRWLTRAADSTVIRAEFDVAESGQEVELSCVLRASAGQAWFDDPVLRRLPDKAPAPTPAAGSPLRK